MKNFLLGPMAVLLLFLSQTSHSQSIPSYVPQNGLVGWWPFNGNANDESGNGLNGTSVGATLTTDRFGTAGRAFTMIGNQHIALPAPASNTFTNSMSYSIWYKEIPNTDYVNIFNASGKALVLNPNANGIRANDGNTFGVDAYNNDLKVNGWKHICVVYLGQNISIYINGKLSASGTTGFNAIIQYISAQSFVGATYLMGGQYPFSGVADDIAIWNRPLTQQEVTNLYNSTSCIQNPTPNIPSYLSQNGLVGWWPFNGNANDESGNGNNGTVNGATLTTDRFGNVGKAYSFDGVNDFIGFGANNNLAPKNISISGWFKARTLFNNINSIIRARGSGYHVRLNGDGRLQFDLVVAVPPDGFSTVSNSTYNNDKWNHFVVSFGPDTTSRLYVNGSLIIQQKTNIGNNIVYGLGGISIGKDGDFDGFFYKGDIDDVSMWNRALSEQEIKNLYNGNICFQNVSVTDTLFINSTITSFNPITYENTIKIYPNPSQGQLTIDFGNINTLSGYQMKVINPLGQQIFQSNIAQRISTIALSSFSAKGVYFVQLIDSKGAIIENRKIVIQ